jgi:hypothetical protein
MAMVVPGTTRSGYPTSCPPTFGTARSFERATWGPLVGNISALLGKPFMPWQQYVMDVALEIDPETGFLAYDAVDVSVPRQSGKTTLTLPRIVWRAETAHLLGGRQNMLYAAQKAIAAKKKWEREFVADLKAQPLMAGRFRVLKPAGNEHLLFTPHRRGKPLYVSTFAPIATQSTSGHGDTLDDGTLDEAFAQKDATVEAAWRPAMNTRPNAQFWVSSTVGYPGTYLRNRMRKGRAYVRGDRRSGTAYFEWSCPPEMDPADPATWPTFMPALGHTIGTRAVQRALEEIEDGIAGFRRAYGNQWPDEFDDEDWVVPRESWAACQDAGFTRSGLPALGIDVTPDRSRSSVSFAGTNAAGLPGMKVVRAGEGVAWVVAEVAAIAAAKGAVCVVLDSVGPAKNLAPDLVKALAGLRSPCPVKVMTTSEVCDAWANFEDAVITEQVRHTGQDEVRGALRVAVTRKIGARTVVDRLASAGDVSPLLSGVHALWGLATMPPPRGGFVASG